MTLAAHMRLGSLEILAALALFALVVRRFSPPLPDDSPRMHVELDVAAQGARQSAQRSALVVSPGVPAIIGRASTAQLPLGDPEVSRRHAELQVAGGVLYLRDLGSVNGTFLNGKRLSGEGIELRSGDYVDVGNTRLFVRRTAPAAWT